MRSLAIVVLAAGCSFPEKTLTAKQGPLACLGQPLPSTAPSQVTITGVMADPYTGMPIAGAAVEGFLVGATAPIFTVTSSATGEFTRDQGTGGTPRETYLRVAPNGYLPTYYYPATPIAGDVEARMSLFTSTELGVIGQVAQVTLDPGKVTFLIGVVDCNGDPVAGATVSSDPPGQVRYFANDTPSPSAISTDAKTGSAMIANVPASNTTISATLGGMALRSYDLEGVAGAIMEPLIQP
ncbi:MAG: hypothetical protein ABIY55_34705 [Kofleriaceae bacterium]